VAQSRFKPGQRIVIAGDHQFSGRSAVYSHPVGMERHVVEFDMMGRIVPIELYDYQLDEKLVNSRKARRRARQRQRRRHHGDAGVPAHA